MNNPGGADPRLLERLREAQERFEGVNELLASPDVVQNVDRLRVLGKERAELDPLVRAADELLGLVKEYEGAVELVQEASDPELRDMATEEVTSLGSRIETLGVAARLLLIPEDPLDDRAAVVEIRAGTGGDEAGMFAKDLFRMYQRVAEREGWSIELMNLSEGIPGSLKEVIFTVRGKGVYGRLRYESGVHRVQRVPETESQGRIHTSTATVAILPEAEDVDVELDPNDLQVDVYRSSGPGGQSVNTTDSAVRITHEPTGIVVQCQNQRSQAQNRENAMKVLRGRLYELQQLAREKELDDLRGDYIKAEWGSQIRSYVLHPYQMVKDHRTQHEIGNVQSVLDGDLDELMETYLRTND